MRLLVLGATGRCGQWVTRLATERGHAVTAVTRPESEYSGPDRVRVERGRVLASGFLESLFADHDAAISCLGLRRASLLPWAPLLSPPDFVEAFSRMVAQSPAAASLERFIWISAGGVGDSYQQASSVIRLMTRRGSVGAAYRDLAGAEASFIGSDVRSLAVRPVTLMGGYPTGKAGPVSRYGLLSVVRRSDVATWMLDVADGTSSYAGTAVLLGRLPD